jgi:Domain of Unknown Function (DUF1080)
MSHCQPSAVQTQFLSRHGRPVALALACLWSALGWNQYAARAQDVPPYAREVPTLRTSLPILQFNGKDLTGFYTYLHDSKYDDPKKVFSVKDGVLDISGEVFGGLTTRDEFRDYVLFVEWKWGERTFGSRKQKARDSGLLLHCVGADGAAGGNWMQSQECQIIEGGCGDFIMVGGNGNKPSLTCETRLTPDGQLFFEKGAKSETRDSARFNWWGRDPAWKDVLGFRGAHDLEKPTGEWNDMKVICDGDSITNIVNGYVANAATKSSLTKGKIIIQSEGAEILFRKIEIRSIIK